jgi:hypothetical protein
MASLLPLSTRCHRAPSSGSKLGFVERFDEGYFRTDLIKCPFAPKSQWRLQTRIAHFDRRHEPSKHSARYMTAPLLGAALRLACRTARGRPG